MINQDINNTVTASNVQVSTKGNLKSSVREELKEEENLLVEREKDNTRNIEGQIKA